MPVRGHGWYKRPYRIVGTDRQGRKVYRAFHWAGARDDQLKHFQRMGWKVQAEDHGPATVLRD